MAGLGLSDVAARAGAPDPPPPAPGGRGYPVRARQRAAGSPSAARSGRVGSIFWHARLSTVGYDKPRMPFIDNRLSMGGRSMAGV
jgi:hypothetical protein